MTTKIFVAQHKKYSAPPLKCYMPIFVGAGSDMADVYKNEKSIQGDHTGDNITNKHFSYNELTSLYWGWKNTQADIKGQCHYRRLFGKNSGDNSYDNLLSDKEIEAILAENDVIVPTPRKFYIMSTYTHYIKSKASMVDIHIKDMECLRNVIMEVDKKSLPALEKVFKSTSAHMLNMFIMKNDIFEKYCTWLFSILEEVEKNICLYRGEGTARVIAAMGEFLLDVYIKTYNLKYKEVPLLELEHVNFVKKVWKRLKSIYMV